MAKGWSQAPATIATSGPSAGWLEPAKLRGRDRRVTQRQVVGRHLAVGGRAAHARDAQRAREVVRHVLLARPGHLDRHARVRLRQLHRLAHVVVLEPAAEAAAADLHMQVDGRFVEPGQPRSGGDDEARDLRAGPDVEPPVLQQHRGVHRFQRGVRQVGHAVLGLQHAAAGGTQRRLDIAVVAQAAVAALVGERRGHAREQRLAWWPGTAPGPSRA